MNAVTMTVYNQVPEQLALTKEAIASVIAQDIPVCLFIIDNGSTDDTWEWLKSIQSPTICIQRNLVNISPVRVANEIMEDLFVRLEYDYILGVPNDVILPPNLYREFLKWPRGVVTGSMSGDRNFPHFDQSHAQNECTPMAVGLVRKWVYDALIAKDGYFFDPRYFLYCSDCDFALRIASCGIRGVQLDLQYYHYGSASHRLANVPDFGGNDDRQKFHDKWGFPVTAYEYGALAADINFRG